MLNRLVVRLVVSTTTKQESPELKRGSRSCYCCRPFASELNELDMALNELGMLSCVTNSREEYVQELKHSHSQSYLTDKNESCVLKQNGLKIIQIDTDFVTGVTMDKPRRKYSLQPAVTNGHLSYNDFEPVSSHWRNSYRNQLNSFEEEARNSRLMRIRNSRLRRFRKPYNVPGRLYHSMQEPDIPLDFDNSSPKHISKSNSNSPNKITTGTLTRSKSLDNLDLARLKLTELCPDSVEDKQSIDQVSFDFNNLQVS
ncbi:hypothetical protein LOTGIDRAFT_235581 [Lottia gigantea]|uniref:Uncharacterized protein n=1 Tax=Lottia gigantea TaxID=225164 RepID=V3ZTU6_LOTGI|nr:hypothetical protein LOTGIDRAFT_235581 [Lottia gigantea]ESO85985.1 hypothetical protein LOTGIDRAFT_235581 [Lottia gigantea]